MVMGPVTVMLCVPIILLPPAQGAARAAVSC